MNLFKKLKPLLFKRHRDKAALSMVSPIDRLLNINGNGVAVGKFTYGVQNIDLIYHPGCPPLSIGRYCSIAMNIRIILGAYHQHEWTSTYPFGSQHQNISQRFGDIKTPGFPKSKGPVLIGHDVWIGHSVTIMSGVTVGNGAVLAAGAHVVKDVKPYEVVGGNPAKHIRYRFPNDTIQKLLEIRWWDFPDEIVEKIAPQLCATPNDHFLNELSAIRQKINVAD